MIQYTDMKLYQVSGMIRIIRDFLFLCRTMFFCRYMYMIKIHIVCLEELVQLLIEIKCYMYKLSLYNLAVHVISKFDHSHTDIVFGKTRNNKQK